MTTIISFLSNIKLTLTQWVCLSLAMALAGLVAAFRLQGTSLHNTQVSLLRAKFGASQTQQDARVDADRKAFLAALNAYQDAKDPQ